MIVRTPRNCSLLRAEFVPGRLELFPVLRLDVEGENNESAKTGRSVGRNVLLGLIDLYIGGGHPCTTGKGSGA